MKLFAFVLMTALVTVTAARADTITENDCRNGYSTMLLTQSECKAWVESGARLEMAGDAAGLSRLNAKMKALMAERADACPCTWDRMLRQNELQKNARY